MALDVFAMVQQLTAECARCGRKAINLCSCPCRQVYYCDVKCQQEHWPVHKADCTKARRGRLPQSFCSYCGVASVSLKSCMCETALYCSFDCQRKHHGTHGRTCSAAVPRFRKRRKKLANESNNATSDFLEDPEPLKTPKVGATVDGSPVDDGLRTEQQLTSKEIQTDVSCEALLISIKKALAIDVSASDRVEASPRDATINGNSSSGNGEMAFRSKQSKPNQQNTEADSDNDSGEFPAVPSPKRPSTANRSADNKANATPTPNPLAGPSAL
jgi:hypothetical protein